eukprot:TRINITY_DN1979_c0_g1_i1.p3 TRINITY_DN1979_c0_g1~~TRINITY_DN1979_c0_g1_i1.p3  ORF type:complete len:1101 (-),score=229.22 TRINITY_DN1979_c0_g1_i1:19219-22521(-)
MNQLILNCVDNCYNSTQHQNRSTYPLWQTIINKEMDSKCSHDPSSHFCKDCCKILCNGCVKAHTKHNHQRLSQAVTEKWCQIGAKAQQLAKLQEILTKPSDSPTLLQKVYKLHEVSKNSKEAYEKVLQRIRSALATFKKLQENPLETLVQNVDKVGEALLLQPEIDVEELEKVFQENEALNQRKIDQFFVEWLESRHETKVDDEYKDLECEGNNKKVVEVYQEIARKASQSWMMLEEWTKRSDTVRKELEEAKKSLEDTNKELKVYNEKITNKENYEKKLKDRIISTKDTIAKLNQEYEKIHLNLQKEEESLKQIQSKKRKAVEEKFRAQEQLEFIKKENTKLLSEISAKEAELKACTRSLNKKNNKLQTVKEDIEKTKNEVFNVIKEKGNLETSVKQLKNKFEEERNELKKLSSEKEKIEQELKSAKNTLEGANTKLKSVSQSLEQANANYEEKVEDVNNLEEQCKELSKKMEEYKFQMKVAQDKIEEYNKIKRERTEPKKTPYQQYKQEFEELEKVKKEYQDKKNTLNALEDKIEKLLKNEVQLKESCEEYEKKVKMYKSQLYKVKEGEEQIAKLTAQVVKLQKEEKQLKSTSKELKNEKYDIEAMLSKERRALEKYGNASKEFKEEVKQILNSFKAYLCKMEKLKTKVMNKVNEFVKRKEAEAAFKFSEAINSGRNNEDVKEHDYSIETKKPEVVQTQLKAYSTSLSAENEGLSITVISAFGNIVATSRVTLSNKDNRIPEGITFKEFFQNFNQIFNGVEKLSISSGKPYEVNDLKAIRVAKMNELVLKEVKLKDNIRGLSKVKNYVELDHCFLEDKSLLTALMDLLDSQSQLKTIKIIDSLWSQKLVNAFFENLILKKLVSSAQSNKVLKCLEIGPIKTSSDPELKAKVLQLEKSLGDLITIQQIQQHYHIDRNAFNRHQQQSRIMAEWEKVMDTIVSNASLRLKELGAEKTALQDQASNLQTSLKENEEQMQFHRNEIKKIIEEINLQTKHKFDQESAIFKNAEELNKLSKEIASMKEKVGITETNYNKEVQETNITHTENTEARKSDTEKDKAMLEGLRIENSNLTNYLEDKSAELQALTVLYMIVVIKTRIID